MKNLKFLPVLLLSIGFFFTACEKDIITFSEEEASVMGSGEQTEVSNLISKYNPHQSKIKGNTNSENKIGIIVIEIDTPPGG